MCMKTPRKYSSQFKADLILQYLKGSKSQAEICREYGLNSNLLHKWLTRFEQQVSQIFEPGQDNEQQQKIAKLERIIGQQTIEIDFLKRGLSRFSLQNKKPFS